MAVTIAPGVKLRRANFHLGEFHKGFDEWLKDAYYVETKQDSNSPEVIIIGRVRNEPPAVEWGVTIGDIVHNLRSALDSVVWLLSLGEKGPPPPDPLPRGSRWRQIAFPIITKPDSWETSCAQTLWAVPARLHAEFKALQPFITGEDSPERESLAVLQELWNIDKHRHPNLTGAFVQIRDIAGYTPEDSAFDVVSVKDAGPFEDGAELARIVWRGPAPSVDKMNVEAHVTFNVAFDKGPPAYGGQLFPTLERFCEQVAQVIAKFSRELIEIPPEVGR